MTNRLVVSPLAEGDLRDAFIWYEQRSAGLGHAFLERVEAKLIQISKNPQIFRLRHGPFRLATTERFPYAIYFIWDERRDAVSVLRVLHFKQDARSMVQ